LTDADFKVTALDPDWYSAVLEEYRSLRSEAVTARDAQLSVLRLAVPLLAALIGLGVTLRSESWGGLLLGITVPVIVILTFELWIGEIQRSIRAGAVVAAIEHRLGDLFKDSGLGPPMGWEKWLRSSTPAGWPNTPTTSQQKKDSVVRALVISGFLLLIAIGSYVLGLHFLWHDDHRTTMYVVATVMGISLLLLGVRIRYAVRGLERRDEVPPADELWPQTS
jgi:hypothetical protein